MLLRAGMAADAATLARIKRTGMGALSPAVGVAALAAALASMSVTAAQRPVLPAMPVAWGVLLKGRQVPFFFEEVKPAEAPLQQLPAASPVRRARRAPALAHRPAAAQLADAAAALDDITEQVCCTFQLMGVQCLLLCTMTCKIGAQDRVGMHLPPCCSAASNVVCLLTRGCWRNAGRCSGPECAGGVSALCTAADGGWPGLPGGCGATKCSGSSLQHRAGSHCDLRPSQHCSTGGPPCSHRRSLSCSGG